MYYQTAQIHQPSPQIRHTNVLPSTRYHKYTNLHQKADTTTYYHKPQMNQSTHYKIPQRGQPYVRHQTDISKILPCTTDIATITRKHRKTKLSQDTTNHRYSSLAPDTTTGTPTHYQTPQIHQPSTRYQIYQRSSRYHTDIPTHYRHPDTTDTTIFHNTPKYINLPPTPHRYANQLPHTTQRHETSTTHYHRNTNLPPDTT